MRFSVRHRTLYRYSAPVRLGAHVLRLHPRQTGVTISRETLGIEPAPAARAVAIDRYGNRVTEVAFAGATDRLLIESRFELETAPAAPLANGLPALPWRARDEIWAEFGGEAGPKARGFATELLARTGGDALAFLDALNADLFSRTQRRIRDSGYAQDPEETLASAKGACRDLAALFMACARSLGLPARFVSGYQAQAETPDGKRHLHAWPEVFLPGAGWRGYDPTHGCAVSQGHVALCAGPDQRATMPVEGGYYGDGVGSTLSFDLEISAS
jgi:transglutaminase-like putative cysteine protease